MDPIIIAPILVLFLSGIFAVLGLGGASIYVPIFFWLGIPIDMAILVGLSLNVITTAISSFNFHRVGLLTAKEYKSAAFIFAGAFLGAPLGVWFAQMLPPHIIIGLFALALFAIAVRMITWSKISKPKPRLAEGEAGFLEETGGQAAGVAMRRAAMGGTTGVLSGTLGIGGGVFLVPFLIESGMTPKRAAILSHVCTLLASILGLLGHLMFIGPINVALLLGTGIAAAIGSFFGSIALSKGHVSSGHIRSAFIVLLLLFAVMLTLNFFGIGGTTVLYD